MARSGRKRLRKLAELVAETYPELDTAEAIRSGSISVDGVAAVNPQSLVRDGASVTLRAQGGVPLRGEAKLAAALDGFAIGVGGRVALDVGAAAGGFTRVLLRHGARRVYAVDAGHGQLLGSLRQDERVVNLERTNLADLDPRLVPDEIGVVTVDVSYLSLTAAIPQLNGRVLFAPRADLVALVKPQFELGLGRPPTAADALAEALERAVAGIGRAGWRVVAAAESPVRGSRGAVEFLVHAVRLLA
jgi:23S rRNA (cytidine1920-2'-O)/16S rRNA (cytidine1409-2'-O)-methyltransferase